MGYDQDIAIKIGQLQTEVTDATSEYTVAQAVQTALASRVAAFDADLAQAQATSATAQSNLACAKGVEHAIQGTMLAALAAMDQALVIYKGVGDTFRQAYLAARQAVQAGYAISDLVAQVTAAEAKNSYMTPQLLAGVQAADATAQNAVTSATTTLQNALTAYVSAERAVWASGLVLAGITDFQRLVSGYDPLAGSDGLDVPDALVDAPPVPDLSALDALPPDADPRPTIDLVVLTWLCELTLRRTPSAQDRTALGLDGKSPAQAIPVLLRLTTRITDAAETGRTRLPQVKGVRPLFQQLNVQAQGRETVQQRACTEAHVELNAANQELARKNARLSAAQSALSAALQAVSR